MKLSPMALAMRAREPRQRDQGQRVIRGRGLRALFTDTISYGAASSLAGLTRLFLVPVYTRYFTVAQYGILENLNALGLLLAAAFGAGLPTAVVQHHGKAESDAARDTVISSGRRASLALAATMLLVGLATPNLLGPLLIRGSSGENWRLLCLAFLASALLLQTSLFLSIFRARFARREYVSASIGAVLIALALNLILVVGLGWGLAGTLVASVISQLVVNAYCRRALRGALRSPFSLTLACRMLAFGLPFAFGGIMNTVIRTSDRYLISALVANPLPRIGLYSMAEKCMAPLSLLTSAFGMAWAPFAMDVAKHEKPGETYLRSFKAYVSVTTLMIVGGAMCAPYLLRVVATPAFFGSARYTPAVGLYLSLRYLSYLGFVGMLLEGRSKPLAPIATTAALLNIGLNFLWIPAWDVDGAIWATVTASGVYNLMVFRAGAQHRDFGFPLISGLCLYAAAYGFARLALAGLVLGSLAILGNVTLLMFAGFLDPEDGMRLWKQLRAKVARS